MRKFAVVQLLLFFIPIMAGGQTLKEELAGLREQLDLPESTRIVMADSTVLPAGTLKVFLAVGFDMELRKNLLGRIEEWNKKKGKQLGLVESVSDISQADVVLAKYIVQEQVRTKTGSATNVVTGTTAIYTRSYVPVYAYVMARKPEGLEILWRGQEEVRLSRSRGTGKLWDNFVKLVEVRGKKQTK